LSGVRGGEGGDEEFAGGVEGRPGGEPPDQSNAGDSKHSNADDSECTVVVDAALVEEVASVEESDEDILGSKVLESDEMKGLALPSLSIISGGELTIYHNQSISYNEISRILYLPTV
jgi:hypothetical protein